MIITHDFSERCPMHGTISSVFDTISKTVLLVNSVSFICKNRTKDGVTASHPFFWYNNGNK